jgi:hypothetical protein
MALANTVQALEELTQTLQFCCVSQLCVTVVFCSCTSFCAGFVFGVTCCALLGNFWQNSLYRYVTAIKRDFFALYGRPPKINK